MGKTDTTEMITTEVAIMDIMIAINRTTIITNITDLTTVIGTGITIEDQTTGTLEITEIIEIIEIVTGIMIIVMKGIEEVIREIEMMIVDVMMEGVLTTVIVTVTDKTILMQARCLRILLINRLKNNKYELQDKVFGI